MKQSERYLQEGSHPRVIVEVRSRQHRLACRVLAPALQLRVCVDSMAAVRLAQHAGRHVSTPASHAQGFDVAKKALLEFLDKFKTDVDPADREVRRGRGAMRVT